LWDTASGFRDKRLKVELETILKGIKWDKSSGFRDKQLKFKPQKHLGMALEGGADEIRRRQELAKPKVRRCRLKPADTRVESALVL